MDILFPALPRDASHPVFTAVPHFLGASSPHRSQHPLSFLAHDSVHIRFYWGLKPNWKEVFLLFCSFQRPLYTPRQEKVSIFSKSHSGVTSLQGIRLATTSRNIITAYWGSALSSVSQAACLDSDDEVPSISYRISFFLGGCSVQKTNFLFPKDKVNVSC